MKFSVYMDFFVYHILSCTFGMNFFFIILYVVVCLYAYV